jgi:hypothetical protein
MACLGSDLRDACEIARGKITYEAREHLSDNLEDCYVDRAQLPSFHDHDQDLDPVLLSPHFGITQNGFRALSPGDDSILRRVHGRFRMPPHLHMHARRWYFPPLRHWLETETRGIL